MEVAMPYLLCSSKKSEEFPAEPLINKTYVIARATHRVDERQLLQRLERLCEVAGVEFPKEAWPKDDRKAYFLLGVCATEDMRGLSLRERLQRLDDWARQNNLLRPNETLFAKRPVKPQQSTIPLEAHMPDRRIRGSECPHINRRRQQSVTSTGVVRS
jgi:hypothetical protein